VYKALADAIQDAEKEKKTLAEVALATEARDQGRPVEEIRAALQRALDVMRSAIEKGIVGDLYSASGLVGGDAAKLRNSTSGPLAQTPFRDILTRALAVQEVNAAMGVIVAAPTAGGAGILPAILTGLAKARSVSDAKVVDGLATAGLIGAVVAERASLSGAEGGCQAENGSCGRYGCGCRDRNAGRNAIAGGARGKRSRCRERWDSSAIRWAGSSNYRAYFGTQPARRSRSRESRWLWRGSPLRFRSTR